MGRIKVVTTIILFHNQFFFLNIERMLNRSCPVPGGQQIKDQVRIVLVLAEELQVLEDLLVDWNQSVIADRVLAQEVEFDDVRLS
jgi:hypothetical protein